MKCNNQELDLASRTHIMGILNVTPDSFFDGGKYVDYEKAVEHGLQMAADGADFLDIGGESSRPGADIVTIEEEIKRVVPVIKSIRKEIKIPISIDTVKSEVARAAIEAGADMINDISGLTFDPDMAPLTAEAGLPIILMHMSGVPKTMQISPLTGAIIPKIVKKLQESIKIAFLNGISTEKIILDPGIGFGKYWSDNFLIIKHLQELRPGEYPLLLGVSRKSFIGRALDLPEDKRLTGTIAAQVCCIMNGANILRVHDVRESIEAAKITDCIIKAGVV